MMLSTISSKGMVRSSARLTPVLRFRTSTAATSTTTIAPSRHASTDSSSSVWREKMADMGPSVTSPHAVLQDMPPPGGFQPVRLRKNSPKKLWNVTTVLAIAISLVAYGWYKYFFTYVRHQQLEHEKYVFMDLALTPVLQAEKDIMLALERRAFRKKVAELKAVDDELRNDDDFQADWDGQFYKMAKKYTYPFNEPQRYLTKQNLSVAFKGTGLMQREKEYLQKLRQM